MKSEAASGRSATSTATATAVAVEPETAPVAETEQAITVEALRDAVLSALENSGQQVLAHNLEQGEWSLRGVEVVAKVGLSQAMIDLAMGDGPKRVIQGALSQTAGRPLRFKMEPGGAQFTPAASASRRSSGSSNGGSARSRAQADPVVKRMQEVFGAEIRTVIDLKERS
jgi:DNA polymerase III subunit gamma/tau